MKALISVFFILFSVSTYGTNRYWIGASDNNWNNIANWSTSSGGGGGASIPGASDVAIFDGNGNVNCNLNNNVNVLGFDIQSGYTSTITQNSGLTITIGTSDFQQASGTFTGGDRKIDLNGNFTISGGTFTATSDTTHIAGNFTHTSGGTFNHNNGTFYFDFDQNNEVYNVNNNQNFYNVIFNANSNFRYLTLASGDTLTVLNDLWWNEGALNTGVVVVKGNTIIGSVADGHNPTPSTLLINGSGVQTGTLHGGGRCSKLIIQNPNATFNSTGTGTFVCENGLQIDSASYNMGTLNHFILANGLTLNYGTFDGTSGGTLSVVSDLTINNGTFTAASVNNTVSGNFTQNNGTFNGNGGQVDITGNFILAGGVHNATNDTTFLAGNFIHTAGGTFNHNNGTFYFDFDQNNEVYDVDENENFYNVVFDANTNFRYLTFSANDSATVLNDLWWNEGSLNTGVVTVKGNTIVGSVADGHNSTPSTLLINGSGVQIGTLHGGGRCSKLIIQNPNATFNSTGTGTFVCENGLQIDSASYNMGTLNHFILANGLTLNYGTFDGTSGGTLSVVSDLTINNGNFTAASVNNTVSGNFTQNNGTFNGNGGQVDIVGNFTLAGGIHNATNDTTFLAGNFTHTSGGTFNHNNGTFYFDFDQNNEVYDVNENENFFNVVFNANTNFRYLTFSANDSVTVLNDLWWNEGALNTGVVVVKGNTTVGSVADGHNSTPSTLLINGSGVQIGTLHGGGRCSKLIIQNPNATFNSTGAGTFVCENGLQIDSGTYIMGSINHSILANGLILNSGTFNGTSGGNLSVVANLTINNGSFTASSANNTVSGNFTQNNGTFNGNGGQVDIAGDFTLAGGIHNATNDTTFLAGNFTQTAGGSFNHNSGTFYFDFDQNNEIYDVNDNLNFFDVIFNSPFNFRYLTITSGDTLTSINNFYLNNGELRTGFLNAKGNITISPIFDGGTASLIFSGSTSQNLNNVGAESNFNGDVYIDMDDASDSVVLASNFIFDGAGQDLTFVKGRFNTTASKKIIIHDGRTVSGASDSSFVDGPFMKIGNDAFTFPTGDSNSYLPIAISAPSNVTDTFTAQYFQVNPDPPYDRSLTDTTMAVSACEYWNLDRNAGGSDVTVTLSWKDYAPGQPCSGVVDLPGLRVARWDGAQWVNEKNMGTTGNTSSGTIDSRVVSSFGPFTLASQPGLNPLPVEITQFDAEEMNNVSVLVSWTTEVEISNHYFLVQRSTDLINWEDVSTVLSQAYFNSGNSSAPLHYETYDFAPHFGTSYYRLKQFDINGDVDIPANPESVYFQGLEIVNLYPNPAENQMNYIVNVHTEGDLDVFVYDSKGRVVSKETYNIEWGINRFTMDVSHFADGVYLLKVATPDHKHYDFKQFITNRP